LRVKKGNGFLALFYVVAIQFRFGHPDLIKPLPERQISPLSGAKVKQFFTKQKIRLLLTAKVTIA
jgi:hypothetical protein